MSDKLTMDQKGIRGLIAALDVERPHPSKAALYKSHPTNILTNDRGVPVMPIYRIVEVVLAAIACDTSDPAIDTLARWALHNATERWTEEGWGDHLPEVGEYDYDRIAARMTELLPRDVTFAEFEAAHKVLADRAETEI